MDTKTDEPRRLNALVERCLDRIETDGAAGIEAVCAEEPELADALRRRLVTLERLGLLELGVPESMPDSIGGYRLLELLGEGGMGMVYRAEDPALGRDVALKMLRPERLLDPGSRLRFLREAEAAARLQHPGIVAIYGVGEHRPAGATSGVPFLALELVEGRSLAESLGQRGTASLGDLRAELLSPGLEGSWTTAVIRLVRDVAGALHHAHERGVLHRDVKPSNIVVDQEGRARLLDFGLARALGDTRTTRTGTAVGSLEYMAPEQLTARSDELDGRVDVFGLGVTLYQLLTLCSPFQARTPEEIMRRIREGVLVPPRKLAPQLSADIEAVCYKALAVEPGHRYTSAADFAEDLNNLLELRPVSAARPSRWRRAWRALRRRPELLAAGVVASLGLTAAPVALEVRDSFAQVRLSEAQQTARARAVGLASLHDSLMGLIVSSNLDFERSQSTLAELVSVSTQLLADERELAQPIEQLIELAVTSFERGAWGPAREALEGSLACLGQADWLDPVQSQELKLPVLVCLSAIELGSGDGAAAREWMQQVIALDAALTVEGGDAVERTGMTASVHLTLALLAAEAGDYGEARSLIERGLERLGDESASTVQPVRARLLNRRSFLDGQEGKLESGRESALESIAILEELRDQGDPAYQPRQLSAALRFFGRIELARVGPEARMAVLRRAEAVLGLTPDQVGPPATATVDELLERAVVLDDLATTLHLAGDREGALVAAGRAVRELEFGEHRWGDGLRFLAGLAGVYRNLSGVYMQFDDPDEAVRMGERAAGIWSMLLERDEPSEEFRERWRLDRAMAMYAIGTGLYTGGDLEGARLHYERVLAGAPASLRHADDLEVRSMAELELGVVAAESGRNPECFEHFDRAEELLDTLDTLLPPGVQSVRMRAGLASCRSNAAIDAGDFARAGDWYEASVGSLVLACQRWPQHAPLAVELREQLESLVLVRYHAGQAELCLEALDQLRELGLTDPEAERLADGVEAVVLERWPRDDP